MSVTAQALDVVYGRAATGVRARLERKVLDAERDLDGRASAGADRAGRLREHTTRTLEKQATDCWVTIAHAETDGDGRILDWAPDRLEQGLYRVVFDIDSYFASLGLSVAYSEVAAVFELRDEADSCQVQVSLAPYSYSMYFGNRA